MLRKGENRTDLVCDVPFVQECRTVNTFKIRDTTKSLDLEFMTYPMYTIAGNDPDLQYIGWFASNLGFGEAEHSRGVNWHPPVQCKTF
jgi:hypothetical protein